MVHSYKLPFRREILQLDPEDSLALGRIEVALFLPRSPLTCVKGIDLPTCVLTERLGTRQLCVGPVTVAASGAVGGFLVCSSLSRVRGRASLLDFTEDM